MLSTQHDQNRHTTGSYIRVKPSRLRHERVTMRVVELEALHVRVALRRKVTHASHVRTDTDNVVVRCKLSDGSTGYGEGVPRDYVTGETIDFSIDLLKRSDLARQLEQIGRAHV